MRRDPELVPLSRHHHHALGAWADLLVQHIRFEERELFERAQQVIPRDEMAAIGDRLATLSREPHLPGDPL